MKRVLAISFLWLSVIAQAQLIGEGTYRCLAKKPLHSQPTSNSQTLGYLEKGDFVVLTSTLVFEQLENSDVNWHRTDSGAWITSGSMRKVETDFCDEFSAMTIGEGVTITLGWPSKPLGKVKLLEFGKVQIINHQEQADSEENKWFRQDGQLHLVVRNHFQSDPVDWIIDRSKEGNIFASYPSNFGSDRLKVPARIDREKLDAKYNLCIRRYVEEGINMWREKGEFEKVSDYQKRVNEKSLREQVIALQTEAIQIILDGLTKTFLELLVEPSAVELSRYDAENETFRVSFSSFGSIILPVSIGNASQFKESFHPENFFDAELALVQGTPTIKKINYFGENGELASYEMSNVSSFIDSEFGDIFESLDFESLEIPDSEIPTRNEVAESPSVSEPNGHIEFNTIPKDIVVERVAVVGAEGINCEGLLRSGQDLASYVEGSLLGYYEAQGIIFTEFGCIGGEETIQVKLVDCQTSELYWSATGHGSSILDVVKEIKANLDK
jgi:hypothetical protein